MKKQAGIIFLFCAIALVGCQTKEEKALREESSRREALYDSRLDKPVDQTKKDIFDTTDSFGEITYAVSSKWNKTEKDGILLYVLNDETGTHIQIEELENPDKKSEADFLNEMYGTGGMDIFERTIAGKTVSGKETVFVDKNINLSFNILSYFSGKGDKMYRFSIVGKDAVDETDRLIFGKLLDSVK